MNRADRRKLNARDFEKARQEVQDDLSSVLLCVWLNVLHDDGESYERLCNLVEKVTTEYSKIEDWQQYRKDTFDKVGISLVRTV